MFVCVKELLLVLQLATSTPRVRANAVRNGGRWWRIREQKRECYGDESKPMVRAWFFGARRGEAFRILAAQMVLEPPQWIEQLKLSPLFSSHRQQ